ncbi:hypothetical protein BDV97DRAFT_372365 [Delphinella strobiligena]|nr:hypothetical protein BDV97DRAFT_372365 [Delphinella strobiligena]
MPVQPSQRFTFVNSTTPYEAKKDNTKKLVRSNAAFSSWSKRLDRDVKPENYVVPRAEKIEQPALNYDGFQSPSSAASSKSQPHETKQAWHFHPPPPLDHEQPHGTRLVQGVFQVPRPHETSLSPLETQRPQVQHKSPLQSSPDCAQNTEDLYGPSIPHEAVQVTPTWYDDNISTTSSDCTSVTEFNIADRLSPSMESTFSLDRMANGRVDPFNSYPVPAEPWYDWVLHHMANVFGPRGWPALGFTSSQAKSYERSINQYVLAEPALFYVTLLFASGDLISLGMLRPVVAIWLRTKAVQAINEALSDPKRAVSEAMILAVSRIAIHESIYGDRIAANTIHRPAQYKMIMMRGGMQALNFSDLTKRLMRWADTIMAIQSETPRYLTEEAEQEWSLAETVDAFEGWVPLEAIALRQKIQRSSPEPSGNSLEPSQSFWSSKPYNRDGYKQP